MKILLAADGSKFTKKALAFLSGLDGIVGDENEVVVLHVQPPVPPGVKSIVGSNNVHAFHKEEAEKVLAPIERALTRRGVAFRASWVVGSPADALVQAAKKEKVEMIVMGTHGHGVIGRAVMGSVAQRVVSQAELPVLLVK
jgi:nucleotide-binding universal stress UspA family protein